MAALPVSEMLRLNIDMLIHNSILPNPTAQGASGAMWGKGISAVFGGI
jgi:hypothetical protein